MLNITFSIYHLHYSQITASFIVRFGLGILSMATENVAVLKKHIEFQYF